MGRRSGQDRAVIVGYVEDGQDLMVLAMKGWGEDEPAWWLNLQAQSQATVHLADRPPRRVSVHAAEGEERDRLWARWRVVEPKHDE